MPSLNGAASALDARSATGRFATAASIQGAQLMGVLFGYFPARRGAQFDPIEALRHE